MRLFSAHGFVLFALCGCLVHTQNAVVRGFVVLVCALHGCLVHTQGAVWIACGFVVLVCAL